MQTITRTALRHGAAPLLAWTWLTGACAPAAEDTSLHIDAYGEEFVEDQIPAEALIDGWTIEFSRFVVAISEVEAQGVPLEGTFVVDLTSASMGEGHELGAVMVPAEGHPELGFTVAPPGAGAQAVAATDDDVDQLEREGWSVLAEGEATRGGEVVRFSWGFAAQTRYEPCHGVAELADDAPPRSVLTFHADHLFYDDLDSEEPNVAFDLVASADANADGEVSPEELRAVDITAEERYQVGSRDVTDLWSFIEAQTTTLGHIDGEGHCEAG